MITMPSRHGKWTTSSYSDIPVPPDGVDKVIKNCYVIAGGLALVLSRNSDEIIDLHYRSTRTLYDLLRIQLKEHGKTNASAALIGDVRHEVAQHADPITIEALRYVFEARCTVEKRKKVPSFYAVGKGSHRARSNAASRHQFRSEPKPESPDSTIRIKLQNAKDRLAELIKSNRSRRPVS